MSKLAQYRKTIAAAIGVATTWAVGALADGHITTLEWIALLAAAGTALGVYSVPNEPAATVDTTVD